MLTTLVLGAGESRRFRDKYGEDYPPKQFLQFQPHRRAQPAQMWENVTYGLTIQSRFYAAFQHRHAHWLMDSRRQPTAYVWLQPTRGQADTLLQALRRIPCVDELLVVNCDNGFGHGALNRLVQEGRYHRQTAALTMLREGQYNEKRWSFVDGHPAFHRAAEKRMLTPMALAGAYYFQHAEEAVYAAERTVDHAFDVETMHMVTPESPRYVNIDSVRLREPYVSEMFQWMPEQKLSVEIDPDDFYDWGTPDSLNGFVQWVSR